MRRRAIKYIGITIILIVVTSIIGSFAYRVYSHQRANLRSLYYSIFVNDKYVEPNPNFLRDYPENKTGKFQFDPQTILASLDQGKTDIFTPVPDDINMVDVEYTGIAWSQADFLRVANALSQQVWNEPLDLNSWDVYHLDFIGDCNDKFYGFNGFMITYYRTVKTGDEMVYTARTISLLPIAGLASWGGDGDFSAPSLFPWGSTEIMKSKTTADEAVRIADDYGGRKARVNSDKCAVYALPAEPLYSTHGDDWHITYSKTQFNVFINPFTGGAIH